METHVHQIQFYDFKPNPFTCLSRNEFGLLACGKADGSIEVYDENQNFFMVALIPQCVCKSVQSLAWFKKRLFCTGALGQIIEIDLQSMTQKASALLVGCPVARCMHTFRDKIMVGNDEGFITIFSITPELTVEQTLPKLSGHILSVAWNKSHPNLIATSTSQGSLWLLTQEDQSWKTLSLALPDASSPTVFWTLLLVKDILFSGDSKGSVNLWDIDVGALLYSFPAHYADVLTLTAAPNGFTIYSSGVDAIIRRFECHISEHGQDYWQPTGIIRGCRRDVHGLAFIPGHQYNPGSEQSGSDQRFEPHKLIAVGQDARLHLLACEPSEKGFGAQPMATRTLAQQVGLVRHESDPNIATVAALPFWSASIAPTRPQPLCFVSLNEQLNHNAFPQDSKELRCLALLHYPDKLTLVRLAQRARKRRNNLGLGSMRLGPLQLAEIRPEKGTTIITSKLSSCGQFIAYSDINRTRVLCVCVSPTSKTSILSVSVKPIEWLSKSLYKSKPNGEQRLSSEAPSRSSTTSSSETDTDTEDLSQDAVAKYFTLNNPLESRTAADSSVNPFFTSHSSDAKQELNSNSVGLPPAHCLAFTPDSENLLLVTEQDGELLNVAISNGVIQWRLFPDLNTGFSFRIYQLHVSAVRIQNTYLVAATCSDGRVRLYNSTNGSNLFTCSCLDSIVGHAPLPVHIAFAPKLPNSDHESIKFTVLYTNGYLREWSLSCPMETDLQSDRQSPDRETHSGLVWQPELNHWLSKFCKRMHDEMSRHFGVFHSLSYMESDRWLLASYGYLVTIKANAFYEPGMIENIVSKKSITEPEPCIRVVKNFRSIMQAEALSSNELALVSIHSPSISLNLAAPLMRKAFGT